MYEARKFPEVNNIPGKVQVDLDEKYPRLADILCDWCLMRHIILRQKEHCKYYKNDIKLIRNMYYSYLDPYYYGFTVDKWVRYIDYCLTHIIWTDKKAYTKNIYSAIYNYGYAGDDNIWFKQLEERIREINEKLTETFIRHFNFETGEVSFSNYDINTFCNNIITEAEIKYSYNRKLLVETPFFKTYLTGNYSLSIDLDSIDIKLNGRYYNKYVYSSVQELYNKVYNFTHQQHS